MRARLCRAPCLAPGHASQGAPHSLFAAILPRECLGEGQIIQCAAARGNGKGLLWDPHIGAVAARCGMRHAVSLAWRARIRYGVEVEIWGKPL